MQVNQLCQLPSEILDCFPCGVVICSASGELRLANTAAEQLLGFKALEQWSLKEVAMLETYGWKISTQEIRDEKYIVCFAEVSSSDTAKDPEHIGKSLRFIFEQSSLPLIIFNSEGDPLHVNRALEELYGVSKEALLGYNIFKDGSTQQFGLLPFLERAYQGESVLVPPFSIDPVIHPDGGSPGRARWLEAYLNPITNLNGEIKELAVILNDVTERLEAQKTLEILRKKFRVTADSLSLAVRVGKVGVWEWLPQENKVIWDETTESIYGYEKGEFSQTTDDYSSHLHPEDVQRCWAVVTEAIEKRQWYTMDHKIIRKDSSIGWVQGSGMPVFDDNNNLIRVLGTALDITERKEQEEDSSFLARVSEILSGSFSYLENISVVGDLLMSRFSGMETAISGSGITPAVLRKGVSQGHKFSLELQKNTDSWGRIDFYHINGDLSDRLQRLAREITEKIIQCLERSALYLASLEAIRARDEFLSIASHELKTPLQSLLLHNEIRSRTLRLGKETLSLPETSYIRSLEVDRRQLHRINRLIEDMLEITRIRNSKLSLMKEQFDIVGLIRDVLERLNPEIEHAHCKISLCVPNSLFIEADEFRIDQVLVNLITNALKYGAGSPVTVTIEELPDLVRVEVADSGPGIGPEDQERIFHRFERASSAGKISGLGLGLYITRTILELHGGNISLVSAPGQGAKFIFHLPR